MTVLESPPIARTESPLLTKIKRLSTASAKRVIEPDEDVPGHVGPGQIIPDELLSTAGLDLELTADQRRTLSREEVGSITKAGIAFEAVLEAGFALEIAFAKDLTDPRVVFLLHEIGEETRHQRIFIRMVEDLQPKAVHPLDRHLFRLIERKAITRIIQKPAMLYTLVLGGEEIPDLIQKRAGEHPDTDPFVQAVNRYHRQEEARHLSFARAILPEVWAKASRVERLLVRRIAPRIIAGMFDMLVHPGVYETIGLPGWDTWNQVRRSPKRVALRHEATRPVLSAVMESGAIVPGKVPLAWRSLCGVDRQGQPVAA
ncbi:MAG: diiron oxygenase [Acidimicrobiales bacterium]